MSSGPTLPSPPFFFSSRTDSLPLRTPRSVSSRSGTRSRTARKRVPVAAATSAGSRRALVTGRVRFTMHCADSRLSLSSPPVPSASCLSAARPDALVVSVAVRSIPESPRLGRVAFATPRCARCPPPLRSTRRFLFSTPPCSPRPCPRRSAPLVWHALLRPTDEVQHHRRRSRARQRRLGADHRHPDRALHLRAVPG